MPFAHSSRSGRYSGPDEPGCCCRFVRCFRCANVAAEAAADAPVVVGCASSAASSSSSWHTRLLSLACSLACSPYRAMYAWSVPTMAMTSRPAARKYTDEGDHPRCEDRRATRRPREPGGRNRGTMVDTPSRQSVRRGGPRGCVLAAAAVGSAAEATIQAGRTAWRRRTQKN